METKCPEYLGVRLGRAKGDWRKVKGFEEGEGIHEVELD